MRPLAFLSSALRHSPEMRPTLLRGYRTFTTNEAATRLNTPMSSIDPEVASIIKKEEQRQKSSILLIASENFAPRYIMDALGSVMTNKYSEGYPGARYYGGNAHIDEAELLCQQRALSTYGLSPNEWGVNVQALSGCPANFAVYTALLETHDRILSLDLPHGGHLSHGYQTGTKKVSAVSRYYEVVPYRLDVNTGLINYDEMSWLAQRYRPKMIVAGFSAYPRHLQWEKFREASTSCGSLLLGDMSHVSGLVAGGVSPSPFEYCDVVTSTTHKSLRGPRGAMIFYRKGQKSISKKTGKPIMYDLENKINSAVFPGLQGGPHNHAITAMAVALKEAASPQFKQYQQDIVSNSKALGAALQDHGFTLISGGTDNHMALIDLRSKNISGAKAEAFLDHIGISVNKNTIPSDVSAMNPSGMRVGTPAMTSRGLKEKDFEQIAKFIDEAISIAKEVQDTTGPLLKDFIAALSPLPPKAEDLSSRISEFASSFPTIGVQ